MTAATPPKDRGRNMATQTRLPSAHGRGSLQVVIPSISELIRLSPGFAKKGLADFKLDLLGLCGFGCRYCSSNSGNYLRISRQKFLALTLEQLGYAVLPADEPRLTFVWTDVIEKLEQQLAHKNKSWGTGETLVFSMLTDGFSPDLVRSGLTRKALELVLDGTSFRIRILTKSSVVGSAAWVRFFAKHADRFVVGLSTGTLDDAWARRVEIGTPPPSARIRALHALQDAGVPTFGMLCPVFPDVVVDGELPRLIDAIRPERCETIWAEPYNDRANWAKVQLGYKPGSAAYAWFESAYGNRSGDEWSKYATDLYLGLRKAALRDGWIDKLVYLLYEANLAPSYAAQLIDLRSVLLQSQSDDNGHSKNVAVAQLQRQGKKDSAAPRSRT